MNHDIFISYSSKQKSVADSVCHYLEENGFKCWMAPRDIPVGSDYGDLIEEAIKTSKVVVLVFSQAASISKWVKGEINVAFTEDKPILPFRIDETEIKGGFRVMLNQMHWIDAFPQYADRLPDLLKSICGFLGRQPQRAISSSIISKHSNSGTNSFNGHEWVDLGLPSGTLWATCNVGAEKPEDYGDYFAWGETKPKTTYHMGTYKYGNISDEVTKYCNDSKSGYDGFIDNLTALQSSDDPATVNWGSDWHTPSKEEWEELMNNTSNKWVIQNGVKGRLFTSKKNGRTIFLPAAGVRCDDEFDGDGDFGVYWSSSLYTDDPYFAWYFNVYSDGYDMNEGGRSEGQSVRPVCSARQN